MKEEMQARPNAFVWPESIGYPVETSYDAHKFNINYREQVFLDFGYGSLADRERWLYVCQRDAMFCLKMADNTGICTRSKNSIFHYSCYIPFDIDNDGGSPADWITDEAIRKRCPDAQGPEIHDFIKTAFGGRDISYVLWKSKSYGKQKHENDSTYADGSSCGRWHGVIRTKFIEDEDVRRKVGESLSVALKKASYADAIDEAVSADTSRFLCGIPALTVGDIEIHIGKQDNEVFDFLSNYKAEAGQKPVIDRHNKFGEQGYFHPKKESDQKPKKQAQAIAEQNIDNIPAGTTRSDLWTFTDGDGLWHFTGSFEDFVDRPVTIEDMQPIPKFKAMPWETTISEGSRHNEIRMAAGFNALLRHGTGEAGLQAFRRVISRTFPTYPASDALNEYRDILKRLYEIATTGRKADGSPFVPAFVAEAQKRKNEISSDLNFIKAVMPEHFTDDKRRIAAELDMADKFASWIKSDLCPTKAVFKLPVKSAKSAKSDAVASGAWGIWDGFVYRFAGPLPITNLAGLFLNNIDDASDRLYCASRQKLIDAGFKNPQAVKDFVWATCCEENFESFKMRVESTLTVAPKKKRGRPRKESAENTFVSVEPADNEKNLSVISQEEGESREDFVVRALGLPRVPTKEDSATCGNMDLAAQMRSIAEKFRTEARIANMISLASAQLIVYENEFDANPYGLNTAGGYIEDMRIGVSTIRPARPDDYLTMLAPFNPVAEKSVLENERRFFADAILPYFGGRIHLLEYYSKILGLFSLGKQIGRIIPMFKDKGRGSSGKSTYLACFTHALGDYGLDSFEADNFLLTDSARKSTASMFDYAQLKRVRLVLSSDVSQGRIFNDSALRKLTQETLIVRAMFTESEGVPASHNLVIQGNAVPEMTETDFASKSRILVMPFEYWDANNAVVGASGREAYVNVIMQNAGNYALRYLIDCCASCFADKTTLIQTFNYEAEMPAEVRQATDIYREKASLLDSFIFDAIDKKEGASAELTAIYKEYAVYCEATGEKKPKTRKTVEQALINHGFEVDRIRLIHHQPTTFLDCRILTPEQRKERNLKLESEIYRKNADEDIPF